MSTEKEEGVEVKGVSLEDFDLEDPELKKGIAKEEQRMAQQRAFAENADDIRHLNDFMQGKYKEAKKLYAEQHPDKASRVAYRVQGNAYVKKKGSTKVFRDLVDRICSPTSVGKTQKSILEEVRQVNLNTSVQDNIWNRQLVGRQKSLVEERAKGHGIDPQIVKGCKTLADVRKAIHTHRTGKNAAVKATVKVAIDDKQVVIGRESYPIQNHQSGKAGKYSYPSIRIGKGDKRQWVRVDLLQELLVKS